jgi:EAL domain-containing protein (putative c-di-GMP-specific phosphodiesterase class I)
MLKYGDLAMPSQRAEFYQILGVNSIEVHLQPILNLKTRAVIGFEGLIRGIREGEGGLVPPSKLFETARAENRIVEMDRLCRNEVLDLYTTIPQPENNYLIFINFESSLLDEVGTQKGYFLDQVAQRKINPADIVIEIIESKVANWNNLIRFVEFYRYHGFLIALDDVGAGYSNFDRMPAIKPDIIKIDRSIVKNMEKDYHKQEIFRSLGNLARKTGTLVLAEGIETEEEAMCAIELDADLGQGYYFARPQPFGKGINETPQRMAFQAQDRYRRHKVKEIKALRGRYHLYEELIRHFLERVSVEEPHRFDALLKEMIDCTHYLEALYILDHQGIQFTETVLSKNTQVKPNRIFQCARKGDDLSLKKYFYLLVDIELDKYITESYISLATGNLCRTITTLFKGKDNKIYVLCMDIAERTGQFIYLYG